MHNLPITGRILFGLSIAAIGIQQFIYSDFRPVILPATWPSFLHGSAIWAFLIGAVLLITGLLLSIGKKISVAGLTLGLLLLFFFIAFQAVFLLFFGPYSPRHLGLWTDPLKESALAGGALLMAGFFWASTSDNSFTERQARTLQLTGSFLFGFTMLLFGIDHFLYTEFVATLVPSWIPGATFWSYVGGIALIASGLAIILRIQVRLASLLLAAMLSFWVIFLHIPRAIKDPYGMAGNEITSLFEAIAFTGIAIVIAFTSRKKSSPI